VTHYPSIEAAGKWTEFWAGQIFRPVQYHVPGEFPTKVCLGVLCREISIMIKDQLTFSTLPRVI
jgi:hypothetical protein